MRIRIALRAGVLFGCLVAMAPGAAGQSFDIKQVADGVYAAIGRPGVASNGAFVVTKDEVIVVDTHYRPSWARELIGEIRKVTPKPVRFVVNTHWHNDHVHGNQAYVNVFGKSVEYLAQHSAREDMRSKAIPSVAQMLTDIPQRIARATQALAEGKSLRGEPLDDAGRANLQRQIDSDKAFVGELKDLQLTLPTITFEKSLILHREDRPIHIYHFGRGHTRGDVVVYLPAEKVVITGDLLTNGIPFMRDAYPSQWIGVLDAIEKLDWQKAIPGHGDVQPDKAQVGKLIAYMKDMVAAVKAAIADGMTLEQARERIDLSRHAPNLPNFAQANRSAIERTWNELTGKIQD